MTTYKYLSSSTNELYYGYPFSVNENGSAVTLATAQIPCFIYL